MTSLRDMLELDGPREATLRVAGFLRHYASMLRAGHPWDVPETIARACENGARVLEEENQSLTVRLAAVEAERDQWKAEMKQLSEAVVELSSENILDCPSAPPEALPACPQCSQAQALANSQLMQALVAIDDLEMPGIDLDMLAVDEDEALRQLLMLLPSSHNGIPLRQQLAAFSPSSREVRTP